MLVQSLRRTIEFPALYVKFTAEAVINILSMDLTILMKFTIPFEGGKPAELDLSSAELGTALHQLV